MAMANLYAWSSGPGKALGRFDALAPPKTIDEMYACAADENERRAIHEMLFGSAMDVVDRFLPDKEKHSVIRGMLAFLAVNSTYRGPYTPRQRNLFGVRDGHAPGGRADDHQTQGRNRRARRAPAGPVRRRGRRDALPHQVEQILVEDGKVTGVRLKDGEVINAPIVVSNLAPETTLLDLVGVDHLPSSLVTRLGGRDHRASFMQIHFALDGLPPQYAAPYDFLNEPGMQMSVGMFGSPEEQQRQWEIARGGEVPDNPRVVDPDAHCR